MLFRKYFLVLHIYVTCVVVMVLFLYDSFISAAADMMPFLIKNKQTSHSLHMPPTLTKTLDVRSAPSGHRRGHSRVA